MRFFDWFRHPSHKHHHTDDDRYSLILETIYNHSKIRIMALTFDNLNEVAQGILSLLDNKTQNTVKATITGASATSDNPAVYLVVVNPDGSITAQSVAAGSGNLSYSATVAYTDSNGQSQSKTLSGTVPVTVSQPAADDVSLVLTFGAPTPIPAFPAS